MRGQDSKPAPQATATLSQEVIVFGECMVELRPEGPGRLRVGFGGDTLNLAIYLARSGSARGIRVSYATALGTEAFSDAMVQAWQAEQIDCRLVQRLSQRQPGLYTISTDARGERSFAYWRGESAARAYFEPPDTALEQACRRHNIGAIVISGISLAILPAPARDRLLALLRGVRQRGGLVVFDSNYRPALWPDAASAAAVHAQALALADIALLTLDDERALHPGLATEALLRRLFTLPCSDVVIKRGREPTLLRVAGQPIREIPTEPVVQVIDSTAAGDAFGGAYLAERLCGATAAQAAAAGNRLAAQVIQHAGAIMPRQAMPAA
ncbi:ketodeoxygluconokinase [Paucibacter sp. KBW04]|uniref:sugar kinase n=1 Tax=Paucibacter sp. KBW04 TaxID=2153361 RepID=UPI000F569D10|nr:sugar kinase [Paucibacter sp. KBW04]RQO61132.1 ketodeoxygluconokinase [Paucibacter sp. KBW04]